MKNSPRISMRVPEIIQQDPYYLAVIEGSEDYLNSVKDELERKNNFVKTATKSELLIMAKAYDIETIFKRIPIERGRQLLYEFPVMIKGKGSEESILRMAQIYIGVKNCRMKYDSANHDYILDEFYFDDVNDDRSDLLVTIYEALKHVNPIGRRLINIEIVVDGVVGVCIRPKYELQAGIDYMNLAGRRIRDIKHRLYGTEVLRMYPIDDRNDQIRSYKNWEEANIEL